MTFFSFAESSLSSSILGLAFLKAKILVPSLVDCRMGTTYCSGLSSQRLTSRFLCTLVIPFASLARPFFFIVLAARGLPLIMVLAVIVELSTRQISKKLIARIIPVKVSIVRS